MNRNSSIVLRAFFLPFLVLLLQGIIHRVWAQKTLPQSVRHIDDVEIEIIREKQIVLPEVNRTFQKIPPQLHSANPPALTYDLKPLTLMYPPYHFSIRPMRLKQEALTKLYGHTVSVGFGNYISPYVEAWFTSKRSENRSYGAHIYHRSASLGPVDEENSATFDTNLEVFGSLYGKVVSADAHLRYTNMVGYFYGYTPGVKARRDTIQQVYHVADMGIAISNTQKTRFSFLLSTDFSYLLDHYSARESEVSLTLNTSYNTSDKSVILLSSDYSFIARSDISIPQAFRHLLKIKPAFQFVPIKNMSLRLGANTIVENDTIQRASFHIYPNILISYGITPSLSAYTGITGDFDKVSLHTLFRENFWINANLPLFHTDRSYEFLLGLKGQAGSRIRFGAGFSRVDLKSLYLYQNTIENRSKFDVLYDDVERFNFFAEVSYESNKRIVLNFRGDYFTYKAMQNPHPWYHPQYTLAFNSFFDIYGKINVNLDFTGLGGMYGFDPELSEIIRLDPALDLNLKITYFISPRFSVFAQLENILSANYPLYLHYRVRKFQALGGVNWIF